MTLPPRAELRQRRRPRGLLLRGRPLACGGLRRPASSSRRLASVEEAGAAQDSVAEAVEVAALECRPDTLEHGATRSGGATR
jgi:hypothetical protein